MNCLAICFIKKKIFGKCLRNEKSKRAVEFFELNEMKYTTLLKAIKKFCALFVIKMQKKPNLKCHFERKLSHFPKNVLVQQLNKFWLFSGASKNGVEVSFRYFD